MDTDAARVTLVSKDRASVLTAIRDQGNSAFRIYERWGLIDDAKDGLEQFASQVENAPAVWEFAQEAWVTTGRLALIVHALCLGYRQTLIDRKPLTNIKTAAPLSVSDVETAIRVHRQLAEALSGEAAEDESVQAQRLQALANSLRKFEPPHRGSGRPLDPKGAIEVPLALMLGDRKPAERRRWTARLVSDFLGEAVTARQVGSRERSRGSSPLSEGA